MLTSRECLTVLVLGFVFSSLFVWMHVCVFSSVVLISCVCPTSQSLSVHLFLCIKLFFLEIESVVQPRPRPLICCCEASYYFRTILICWAYILSWLRSGHSLPNAFLCLTQVRNGFFVAEKLQHRGHVPWARLAMWRKRGYVTWPRPLVILNICRINSADCVFV